MSKCVDMEDCSRRKVVPECQWLKSASILLLPLSVPEDFVVKNEHIGILSWVTSVSGKILVSK